MRSGDGDGHVVGLSAELARLGELADRAEAGELVVAVVEGVSGQGKSTLLRMFLASRPSARIVALGALPWERDQPGALLERLLTALDAPPVESTAGLLEAAARLTAAWGGCAELAPLIVAIDDAHAADPLSLRAIGSSVVRTEGPLLLLLVRGTDPAPAREITEVFDRLPSVPVPLRPLSAEQTRTLAARLAGVDLPLPVARRLAEHAGGIPQHLVEILRDTPPVRWSDWQIRLPAPAGEQARVDDALAGCSPPARALVEGAAVLGPSPVLADAAAIGRVGEAVAALDEAARAGLLIPRTGHGLDLLTFPGRFVRGAVYAGLAPARRHELHHRAAEVVTDPTDRLRHRIEAAPLPDPALADELVALARQKSAEGAWAVAAGALTDAARISRNRADRESRLLAAVDALAGAGLLGQAVDALPDVEALPSGPHRDATLAYVAIQRGRRREAEAYLETAWRGRGTDRASAAVVCQRNVLHALADWRGDDLVQWAGRAVEHAAPGSPPAIESRAVVGLGHAARGDIDQAFTDYRAAIRDNPSGPQHQRARMGLGWLHLARDNPEEARRELEYAVPTVRQTGSNRISLWALAWLARTRFVLGDWDGALQSVDQAEILLDATGLEFLRPLVHWTGAQVRSLRGEHRAAERHQRQATASEHDYTVMTVPALLTLSYLAEAASDHHAVLRHLAPLATRRPRAGLDEPGFWPWHDHYAMALVLTGRLTEADEFLAPLERLAGDRGHRSCAARLHVVRGRLHAARGDVDEGGLSFDRARALLAELPMPYESARVDYVHGLALRRAGRRRDAADRLTVARQGFVALGARVLVERCDRELKTGRKIGSGTASPHSAALTQQEQTIASLVATGMSNREVAAELLLSVKTVQFHLTRVYTKLGVRSRSELAARGVPRTAHA
jgi:DNA-binding CsgD family transcriptional regulator/tetratricopeptide (TPR) repeat protein